jgi:hypothetical protein
MKLDPEWSSAHSNRKLVPSAVGMRRLRIPSLVARKVYGEAEIVSPVHQLNTSCMAEATEFESQQGQVHSSLHVVHTGSEFHQVSCPINNDEFFLKW